MPAMPKYYQTEEKSDVMKAIVRGAHGGAISPRARSGLASMSTHKRGNNRDLDDTNRKVKFKLKASDKSGHTDETMGLRFPAAGGSSTHKASQLSITQMEIDRTLMPTSGERCDTKPLSDSGASAGKTLDQNKESRPQLSPPGLSESINKVSKMFSDYTQL